MSTVKTEALFYHNEDGACLCGLCPHSCKIPNSKTGLCGVRLNENGVLVAESFGKITSAALDPIEKKPLYRFERGIILSIGSYGCNFTCGFCQNHGISQARPDTYDMSPMQVASLAEKYRPDGNIGIAFTYNEPFISYEFVYECSRLNRERGMKNVLVTNGYVCEEPLQALLPLIDAMNIDLKSYSSAFYRQIGGELEPVKLTIAQCARRIHVEITTLIIPGQNDSEDEIDALAAFLADIDPDIPLHLLRFRPEYKMLDTPPTTADTVSRLGRLAKSRLHHVFVH